ncbi:hypothetical protein EDI_269670 [Entamoeba dispar SAW760]|uniref:Uncharacterized protein n=1 Tax=Entamoeba dispar (strain ATCC PRA-260 / SAW760) TaxID=370354 RepID=B0ERP6_ENTDS|nr:uncharacterized protein EDI_269670 [Entamoeba dispar SAW760]EDR22809.1 hypothetical protein EDI_269670 [Entamoeba dispar SAW760]|eukprot:EDR22809.1 hypothetical protein EDI_269670 [Entamoeba dispar SAW760]
METTSSFDEHIFLETYYQASGCSSKISEHATRIRLLLNELNKQMSVYGQTSHQIKELQNEYQFVHGKIDGTIPVDEVLSNPKYNQLVDGLKVTQEDVVEFHNDIIDDENWNKLDKLIQNVHDTPQHPKQVVLNFNLMNDYCQKDEVQILKDRIQELETENKYLKDQLHEIKDAYNRAQQSRHNKSPFYDQVQQPSQNI